LPQRLLICALLAVSLYAQQPEPKPEGRVLGVLPNYRTVEADQPNPPLSNKGKLAIAAKDTFDYPLFGVSAFLAGINQLTGQNQYLGQGLKGYGKRYVRVYGDMAIGNLLTEGALPVLLKEDPRYYRRGKGPMGGRIGYAATRIFVTRTDSGRRRLNLSELLGTAITVGISRSYSREMTKPHDYAQKFGVQLATDSFSFILKEIWPDIHRKLKRK
jgi:hypothetical protein